MAFKDTRRWASPALCGCELDITATWPDEPEADGVENRHPIPFTITDIQVASVCLEHEAWETEPVGADPYMGSPGYIKVPVSPTKAENLYIHLFKLTGQKVKKACGCVDYECHYRDGQTPHVKLEHPKHTKVCRACKK